MSEILGHDCNNKPLRAGDRVIILNNQSVRPEFRGRVCTITGIVDLFLFGKHLLTDIPSGNKSHGHGYMHGAAESFRRVDDKPDLGSWDEVRKSIGWTPGINKHDKTEEKTNG